MCFVRGLGLAAKTAQAEHAEKLDRRNRTDDRRCRAKRSLQHRDQKKACMAVTLREDSGQSSWLKLCLPDLLFMFLF